MSEEEKEEGDLEEGKEEWECTKKEPNISKRKRATE